MDADDTADNIRGTLAERAAALAARAQELAGRVTDSQETAEELARLERELADLDAEERALDDDMSLGDPPSPGDDRWDDADETRPGGNDWSATLVRGLEGIGEMVMSVVDQALAGSTDGPSGNELRLEQAVDGTPSVAVSNGGGSVTVTGGAPGVVRVHAVRRGRVGDDLPPASVELRDGVVHVSTPRSSWRSRPVRLTIETPPGSALDVKTGGGGVEVTDVGGPLTAKSGGGGLRVTGAVGPVDLRTGGGSIEVTDTDGEVKARTGGGSVRVHGRLEGDSMLLTGGGSITVAVTPDTSIEVNGRGHSVMSEIAGVGGRHGRIWGRIGDGTQGALRVRTGGGSIRILQAPKP